METINDKAFYKCLPLSSFSLPSSVTYLGDYLFYECNNLNDFYVDSDNTHYSAIDGVLFSKDLKTLVYFPGKREGTYCIPEGTESINTHAFTLSKIGGVDFPTSVTSIGYEAFSLMENLYDITIPCTVTNIGNYTFYSTNLKRVVLPENLTIIPEGMFMSCSPLRSVEIPGNTTSIGSRAFAGCGSLRRITIPSTVTSIGDSAFYYSGLNNITSLMQTPCAIKSKVFENVDSYSILYVPEESLDAYKEAANWNNFTQILSIGEKGDEPYTELYNGVLSFFFDKNRDERKGEIFDLADYHLWLENSSSITKVTFDTSFSDYRPTSTSHWFGNGWHSCDKLTEIQGMENLNTSNVTDMSGMFQGCSGLISVDISNFNTGNVTDMSSMFAGCSNLTSIDLSNFNTEKVTSMSAMFGGCDLNTVILPNNLKFIDSRQFVYCSSLEEIAIPASVTSIGERAFHYCTSLKGITIPSGVTSIGDNAFSYSDLTKVISLMDTPCAISSTVFENVSNNAILYVPSGCKTAYEAADYWKDFKEIVEINFDELTLNAYGIATYCSTNDLDFTEVDDLKAYVASNFNPSTGELTLTRVYKVPAGEGLLLKGNSGDYMIPFTTTDAVYTNLLKGVTTATDISATDGDYTNFILANGSHGIGFYTLSGNGQIAAGKAYLQLPTSEFSTLCRQMITLTFDDEQETTGISNVRNERKDSALFYDLQGRRVEKPVKGLYIVNNKKVFIK